MKKNISLKNIQSILYISCLLPNGFDTDWAEIGKFSNLKFSKKTIEKFAKTILKGSKQKRRKYGISSCFDEDLDEMSISNIFFIKQNFSDDYIWLCQFLPVNNYKRYNWYRIRIKQEIIMI